MAHVESISLVVGLFLLGVLSPGPNFVVVVQASLAGGRRAGVATGLGVATGDAIYAAAGLAGLATFIAQMGIAMSLVKLVGGLYLVWLGASMMMQRRARAIPRGAWAVRDRTPRRRYFVRGLLTDLSNPKTIVFFASIFALAYDPSSPAWVAVAMWVAIVASSVLWRAGLSFAFSRRVIRDRYARVSGVAERVCGAFLALFGVRLAAAR